ncbi:MAG: bifunctional adenosylcobinamide kinase/adenosylcobinamide-phosphate guanylyltransferase [Candidatus Binataceae bacterium]
MATLTLITGGARSGKSSHALAIAAAYPASARRCFIATAEDLDDEMRERITRHRAARPAEFTTVEEPLALCDALGALNGHADIVVLDCLTLWISNLLGRGREDDAIMAQAERLAIALTGALFATVVVSGEVGWGIVPENPLARRFRDLLGWTNQKVARVADEVILMAAGYPLRVK